jgi:hypothetical protein
MKYLLPTLALIALGSCFSSRPVLAAVTQPDGVVMPLPNPAAEVGLQELFDFKEGPGVLSSVDDAATQPATFKPLCDFTAQLLLHETGNKTAAVGWYNSPVADVAPKTVCDETTGMSSGGGACTQSDIFILIRGDVADPPFGKANDPLHHPGKVFTGADIAASQYYAGGEIGFVLLSSEGHFSETRLNPLCTGDKCVNGDHWIPTIMYESKKIPRGYYMCSEDQNVGPSTWGANDGDFNDYVFLFTGLVCSGSGMPCDTGEAGVCAAGLTDCADALGDSECRPARSPSDETCNGLDDDCNGQTDEGELCPQGELCVKARCVPVCGTGEFRCDSDHQCVDGACVENACVDKICTGGKVCMGGKCVGACDDVTCPTGQTCQDGVCVDPCTGIDCGEGFVCEGGACLVDCSCAGCAQGECDAMSGHCVDKGCAAMACDAGQHCAAGKCVDDCAGAQCPGGAACHEGVCDPPASGSGEGGAGGASDGTGNDNTFGGEGIDFPTGTAATGNASTSEGGAGSGEEDGSGSGSPKTEIAAKGCSCRLATTTNDGALALFAALGVLGLLKVRRRAG